MAGTIPRHFIDQLLQRIDIIDVIDGRVPLKKAGRDFQACCPFHDEKTPSFTVSQVKQFYHCFGCGANGSAIGFLMEYDHMSFPEAVEELAKQAGLEIPYEQGGGRPTRKKRDENNNLIDVLENASRYFRKQLRQHNEAHRAIDYLKHRGLSGEIASRFELGFAPQGWDNLIQAFGGHQATRQLETAGLVIRNEKGRVYDRFRDRVIFPIRDHRGRTIGFGGRVIDAGEPKYLNSPETPVFHKGSELYGLYKAMGDIKAAGFSLVVEGYMDVVALAQNGVDNAVATLGTATTTQHLNRLFRVAPHIVFCFDGDRAGRDAARKAMETAMPEMRDGRQVSFLFLPDGQDPDDFVRAGGKSALLDSIQNAQPLEEFLFQHLKSQTSTHRSDGRARMIDLAKPFLSNLAPGAFKEMLMRRLANESGIDDIDYLGTVIKTTGGRQEPDNTVSESTPSNYLHHLVSLLLQNPQLISQLNPIEGLSTINPGGDKLIDTLRELSEQSGEQLSTAILVEHFRNTPYHKTLEKLAGWNHQISPEQLSESFEQMVSSVQREVLDQAIDQLNQKAASGELTAEDKRVLPALLRRKSSLRFDVNPA